MTVTEKTGGRLRLILGDQLTRGISALSGIDPARDVVLMVEVAAEEEGPKAQKNRLSAGCQTNLLKLNKDIIPTKGFSSQNLKGLPFS